MDQRVVKNVRQIKTNLFLLAALTFIVVAVGGPLLKLFHFSSLSSAEDVESIWSARILYALRFSFLQAIVSAFLSVVLGVLVATVLASRKNGRLIVSLLQVPFALPSVAVAFSFILAFGMSGYVNQFLKFLNLPFEFKLYGGFGIILANVYFNTSFAALAFANVMALIPQELVRSMRILNLNFAQSMRIVILPHLYNSMKSIFLNVMIFCLFNFTISLILGGGPAYATLEVLIYQSIHFDFQPDLAARISVLQLLIGLLIFFPFRKNFSLGLPQITRSEQSDLAALRKPFWLNVFFGGFVVFILTPLFAIVVDGIKSIYQLGGRFDRGFIDLSAKSLLISTCIAIVASLVSTFFAAAIQFKLLKTSFSKFRTIYASLSFAILLISPVVLSLSFLLSIGYHDELLVAIALILFIHIILRLPFSLIQMRPAIENAFQAYERSCQILNLSGIHCFRKIYFPILKREFYRMLSLSFLFSLAEMSVVSMFGNDQISTLPLLIYRLMGAYRFQEASVLTLIFVIICAMVFWFTNSQRVSENGSSAL